jgi:lysophospholipase L1-like esterase
MRKGISMLYLPALVVALACGGGTAMRETSTILPGERQMRFLALGDSYTIGESVPATERWPVQLTAMLNAEGIPLGAPQIIARTGWTTDELSAAIDAAAPQGTYDLVSLLIGVNNQYRNRDAEQYRTELRTLLQRAVAFAGGEPSRVLVLSIPDWGVTPFAASRDRAKIASEIDVYNAVKREEASRIGARWVDITPGSRMAATDPTLVAGDGLHPSGSEYAKWARAAFAPARAALDSR